MCIKALGFPVRWPNSSDNDELRAHDGENSWILKVTKRLSLLLF